MILRKFNERGVAAFADVLARCRLGERIETPLAILETPEFTIECATRVEIREAIFSSRYELARGITDPVKKLSIANEMSDIGLWSWLSAAYFDSVCPMDADGVRNPKSDYRHIPSSSYKHFYRHLIRGPVRIYRFFKDNPELALIVLCQSPASPGDFVEQLASRQERVTSRAIIGAANVLYFDATKKKPKRGAAPNSREPGTLRRYMDVLDQLELTYDLYSMSPEELLAVLPREFKEWMSK